MISERAAYLSHLRSVLRHETGRQVLHQIMDDGLFWGNSVLDPRCIDVQQALFNEGRRYVATRLFDDCCEAAPGSLVTLITEAINRKALQQQAQRDAEEQED